MMPRMAACGGLVACLLCAQTGSWPTYHGDYSGRRFSPLRQINQGDVKHLSLAWVYRTHVSTQGAILGGDPAESSDHESAQGPVIKSSPLMVDGVLYFSVPNHAYAVDAATGQEIWHYIWRGRGAIGNRGVALWGRWLYFETPDNNLVSLEAATGKERWHKPIVAPEESNFSTVAPVAIGNHILTGTAGDSGKNSGWLEARDPETGDLQWRWYGTPRAGQPGIETWPSAQAADHGGGGSWQPPTFDPKLNLIYVTTGNPAPVYVGKTRGGDNLWTSSIVALDANTGKLVWFYQCSPHDTHDWDATEVAVLIDADFGGRPRKLLAMANRNGYYYLLDRQTGEALVVKRFIPTANAYRGLNDKKVLIPEEAKEPQLGGTLVSPSSDGAANYPAPSFDPETGFFYVNTTQSFSIYYAHPPVGDKDDNDASREWHTGLFHSALLAIDYRDGAIKWRHDYPGTGFWSSTYPGILTTAGQLLFTGNPTGDFVARDPISGHDLWHAGVGTQLTNSPETYLLNSSQYVTVAAGDQLFSFWLQR